MSLSTIASKTPPSWTRLSGARTLPMITLTDVASGRSVRIAVAPAALRVRAQDAVRVVVLAGHQLAQFRARDGRRHGASNPGAPDVRR